MIICYFVSFQNEFKAVEKICFFFFKLEQSK